ncbi:MAG: restriction endonuclease subunit S [Balneola sp.]
MKLEQISDISFGSVSKTGTKGRVPCLQVVNITPEGDLDFDKTYYAVVKVDDDISLLHSNSIVLPAKGQKFSSALISTEHSNTFVASSSLFVIRVINSSIIPKYLHWYLNRAKVKWQLESVAAGSNISSLSIKELRSLRINVPELDIQKKIVELKEMQEKELMLIQRLGQKRKKLIEAITKELIQ